MQFLTLQINRIPYEAVASVHRPQMRNYLYSPFCTHCGQFRLKTVLSLFVISLIQLRKVQFNELATVFNEQAKIAFNQNRIQDFFREVEINFQAVAQLMPVLLPKKGKLRLTIDRTDLNASPVAFREMSSQYFDGTGRLWRLTTTSLLGGA